MRPFIRPGLLAPIMALLISPAASGWNHFPYQPVSYRPAYPAYYGQPTPAYFQSAAAY